MSNVRNLVGYGQRRKENLATFVYTGTLALKRGDGMCFALNTTDTGTGELATDPWGRRGQVEIAVPSASNANRFAGVLTRSYEADADGKLRVVELAMPGGCAMISQRVISTVGLGRVTCIVDSVAGGGISGKFAHGGLPGRGSAVPLETLAAATSGDLALTHTTTLMTANAAYSSSTGLTTITMTGAGTAMGYLTAAVDASQYECTVVGGGALADGVVRATQGVYPVVQATGANTFTVTGNTGDAVCTVFLTKKNLLKLAYLEDGRESGLSDYVTPLSGAAAQFVLNQGGCTFICGGSETAQPCTVNTLADPVVIGGLGDGARKAFCMLGTQTTGTYLVTVTSGEKFDGETDISTLSYLTAGHHSMLEFHGDYGIDTSGRWALIESQGATIT